MEAPSVEHTPWRALPDELCKYIAQQYFLLQHRDVVSVLRLVCTDWKDAVDRSIESLYLTGRTTSFLKTQMTYVKHVTVHGAADANLLENLGKLPILSCLELHNVSCPEEAFESVPKLASLQQLKIVNMRGFTEKKAEHLTALTRLTACSFDYCCAIHPNTFQALATLPQLQSLTLKGCYNVEDVDLEPFVTGRAQLTQLHLVGWCKVTKEGLQKLSVIPSMKDLHKGPMRRSSV